MFELKVTMKNDNGKIFDGNVDARNHRAEVERMIS